MRTDWQQRAAELFPNWPDARRARWVRARAQVNAPRVRVGCGNACDDRGVFAPRTLREADAIAPMATRAGAP